MHDEDLAIIEIRELSSNAKMFLQHEIRSALTILLLTISENNKQAAIDEIWLLKNKLVRWGL